MTTRANRSRRGVGGIISGVILIAILVTSVLAYFVTIANNDKAKTGYELTALEGDRKKATEVYSVSNAPSGGSLDVTVQNNGPIPIRASQMILYCTSCANPDLPVVSPVTLGVTVNPGSSTVHSIGPVTSGSYYRVDVISERGNIVSTSCGLEGTECEGQGDDDGGVNEGIIQGTGSIQLDFNAFGSLFPELADRDGVQQTGWKVLTSSAYGSATGYPAFELPQGLRAVIVEKMRNMDLAGNPITLNRNTALIVNVGKTTSGQPDPNYICYADKTSPTLVLQAYDETTTRKTVLPWTELDAERDENWQEVFFCSTEPSTATNPWTPDAKFNNINGIFMVARGTFSNSNAEYAQTIPYQSIMVGEEGIAQLNACLRDLNVVNSCPDPKSAPSLAHLPLTLKYSESASNLVSDSLGARTLYVHINTASPNNPNPPFDVSWVYGNGVRTILRDDASVPNGTFDPITRNILVEIPHPMPDGSDIVPGFYTIIVSDSYSSESTKNVYYMTFQVT